MPLMSPMDGTETSSPLHSANPSLQLIRTLSFNIQVGMHTAHYAHYLTGAWRHVLPSRGVRRNLDRIAELLCDYDCVGLQEVDAGSLRTAQLNQVEYLAARAGFSHFEVAVNRNLAPLARHALAVLSRVPLHDVRHHPLPGRVPGRGALEVHLRLLGRPPLQWINTHLALGTADRQRQLEAIAGLIKPGSDCMLMGDLNCTPAEISANAAIQRSGLHATHHLPTHPSWKPRRCLDHILLTPGLQASSAIVLEQRLSDHCPVALTLKLRTA
ncbi:MAG TPA: endonuclease/exonuclease/phosphatase family protein [Fontimonas sp.]